MFFPRWRLLFRLIDRSIDLSIDRNERGVHAASRRRFSILFLGDTAATRGNVHVFTNLHSDYSRARRTFIVPAVAGTPLAGLFIDRLNYRRHLVSLAHLISSVRVKAARYGRREGGRGRSRSRYLPADSYERVSSWPRPMTRRDTRQERYRSPYA